MFDPVLAVRLIHILSEPLLDVKLALSWLPKADVFDDITVAEELVGVDDAAASSERSFCSHSSIAFKMARWGSKSISPVTSLIGIVSPGIPKVMSLYSNSLWGL